MPLKALVIIILILTLFLLIPLGIDGGYSGGLSLSVRIGFLNIRIFPRKKKPPKLKRPKKAAKKKEPEKHEVEKKKEPFDKEKLKSLIRLGLKTLGRLKRKLHVDYLRIRYVFASDDPFSTAMSFGYSSAALGAVVPLIDNALDIGERDIGTSFDFTNDKPVFDCWLTTTIHVWEVFYIAIAFAIDYFKLKRSNKREDRK